MSPIVLFGLLLILSFGVVFYLLRPTSTEVAVQEQLEGIGSTKSATGVRTSILKEEVTGSNVLMDEVVRRVPWLPAVSRLIRQAGVSWRPSSVILFSFLAGLASTWFA